MHLSLCSLVGDVAIGIKELLYKVDNFTIEDSSVFFDPGHKDGLVKGCLGLVDDGAIDIICLLEGSYYDVVLVYTL